MADVRIMWFRRDLRVRDLPALVAAAQGERTVALFVFDDRLLAKGRFPSAPRTAFMLGCLRELDAALRARGGRLVVRHGKPEREVPRLAEEVGARSIGALDRRRLAVVALARPGRDRDALAAHHVTAHPSPGACAVDDPARIRTKHGKPYTVFSPVARSWAQAERRDAVRAPRELRLPPRLRAGRLPKLAARPGEGPKAYRNELAWRDFYAAVLMHFPFVVRQEFQERCRDLEWARPGKALDAWRQGRTGYPLVDAGMRQLLHEAPSPSSRSSIPRASTSAAGCPSCATCPTGAWRRRGT